MRTSSLSLLLILLPSLAAGAAEPAVAAVVETTLATDAGQIRQFALDGDRDTFFASAKNAGAADHFTLTLDAAVKVQSVAVTTGRPKGGDALAAGALEVSEDGKKFESVATFADGV